MFFNFLKNSRIKRHSLEINNILGTLESGDIILLHTKNSLVGALIRKLTKCYWNHAALVLTNFYNLPEYKTTIVIEAQDEGVIAHRIGVFLDPKKFDIAIKRVPGLSGLEKDIIKRYLLSHIDVPYDTARLFDILIGMFTGKMLNKFTNMHQVICTSLIQKAFYTAMPPQKKHNVIFAPHFKDETDFEFVSPADIARSDKAIWIYNPRNL